MVSNVLKDSLGRFGGASTTDCWPIRRVAGARRNASPAAVAIRKLAGVTVDFENLPDAELPQLAAFLDELRAAMGPGLLLTQTLQDYLPPAWVSRFAEKCDRVILMFYDEHYDKNDPGPVADAAGTPRWWTASSP